MIVKNKILNFLEQTKQEVAKITWPLKKEVMNTSVIISIIFVFSSMFFLLMDSFIHYFIQIILNI